MGNSATKELDYLREAHGPVADLYSKDYLAQCATKGPPRLCNVDGVDYYTMPVHMDWINFIRGKNAKC